MERRVLGDPEVQYLENAAYTAMQAYAENLLILWESWVFKINIAEPTFLDHLGVYEENKSKNAYTCYEMFAMYVVQYYWIFSIGKLHFTFAGGWSWLTNRGGLFHFKVHYPSPLS